MGGSESEALEAFVSPGPSHLLGLPGARAPILLQASRIAPTLTADGGADAPLFARGE